MKKPDFIDWIGLLFIVLGTALFIYGVLVDTPASLGTLILDNVGDWSPSFFIDGILLLTLNYVVRQSEKRRVINQFGSLSREFALDAVRRCREEGWLHGGAISGKRFEEASLSGANLSDAKLSGVVFRFAQLAKTDFTYTDLRNTNFEGADLQGADLRWADLRGACFRWANLEGVDFSGAKLDGATADFASIDKAHQSIPELQNAVVGGLLSAEQVGLIRLTFDKFSQAGDAGPVRFYERLFTTAPQVRSLFPEDITAQARKLAQSLKVIVSSLGSKEHTIRVLKRLGSKHVGYGAQTGHYAVVGQELLGAMKDILGDDFTDEAAQAWGTAFKLIATVMISAAEEKQTTEKTRKKTWKLFR